VLGKGAFGEVHAGFDTQTNAPVAIKIEPPSSKKQVLKLEVAILRKLANATLEAVVAAMKASLPVYTFMVMELLGPNLSEIRRNAPEHRFPPSVIADIGVQMLHGIQSLHAIGVVHRDIKPGNFCVGVDYTPEKGLVGQRVYMIDFGLSRKFVSGGGIIREARQKVGFRGTSRYASLRAHKGQDLGPVDDLWTFFYLLVEFTTGSLPWKGKEKDRIAIVKGQYHDAPLGTEGHITFGLPEPLVEMWKYLAQLDYADMVDY
ncbi:kinase-like domain-containing protein, partial [Phlyctochytrium arcticum]